MKTIHSEVQRIPIFSWCADIEDSAMAQAQNLARHPVIERHVALMPDCHAGMGMPIGGVVAVRDAVIPNAVGVDIGCGMVAVETNIPAEHFADMTLRRELLKNLKRRIPVGEGVSHDAMQEWEGFERKLEESSNYANDRECFLSANDTNEKNKNDIR